MSNLLKKEPNNTDSDLIHEIVAGTILRTYRKKQILGKGGFATVYSCEDIKTYEKYALKMINKELFKKHPEIRNKLFTEINIHRDLDHPNITKFHTFFENNEHVVIVLEHCSRTTLDDLLRKGSKLSVEKTQKLQNQLLDALIYLKDNFIIHRDLKLSNIFLDFEENLKLGDFGLAAKLHSLTQKRRSMCGTPNYIAPEILSCEGHSFEVDIWSFGIVMYTLQYGRMPFETNNVRATYGRIQKCLYVFPENSNIPEEAKSLIQKILIREPSTRMGLHNIKQHSFMTNDYSYDSPDFTNENLYSKFIPNVSAKKLNVLSDDFDNKNVEKGTYKLENNIEREMNNLQNRLQELTKNANINNITKKYIKG